MSKKPGRARKKALVGQVPDTTREKKGMRSKFFRKLSCLFLAAGICLACAQPSEAIEFKAKGVWLASFQYGQHGNFSGKGTGYDPSEDEFEARSRVRIILDAVASENLSGQVYFEIGKAIWGKATNGQNGMALGGDQNIVKVKRAYIDWMVPNTALKLRMGLQGIGLPYMAMDGPTVFQSDVAAITASYTFNPNVSVTAFWARPYNDNYTGNSASSPYANYMDNMDMAGLVIPLRFDGFRLTPWGMFAAIGPNVYRNGDNYFGQTINGVNGHYTRSGLLSLAANSAANGGRVIRGLDQYATAWWGGLSGEITYWDPFRVAWDFMYGSVSYDDSALDRQGWLAALLLEYKLDWVTLGLYGWYASGDDANMGNGSERLPTVSNDYGVASFSGTFIGPDINGLERDRIIGNNLNGTWGVGFRLKNMSFLEDLKHTFHISLMGGTNDPGILKEYYRETNDWMLPNKMGGQTTDTVGRENMYLTTRDYAMEVGLLNQYQIYENLAVNVEASYVALWLDKSDDVWGHALEGQEINDAWNVSVLFIYSF